MLQLRYRLSYALGGLAIVIGACSLNSSPKVPPWTKSEQRASLYPTTLYVQGFAQGKLQAGQSLESLLETLSAIARKELIESIEVKISQTGTLISKEENNSVSSSYTIQAQTQSAFEISNIQTLKYYQPQIQTAFVFAYAAREDLVRVYSQGLDAILETAENYLNQGNRQVESPTQTHSPASIRQALQAYAKAMTLLDSIEPRVKLLNNLGNKLWVGSYRDLVARLHNQVPKILEHFSLHIRAQAPPNPAGEFWQAPDQAIQAQVLGADSLAIADIPLVIKLEGKLIAKAISDKHGQLSYNLDLLRSSKARQSLQIQVDLASYLNTSSKIAAQALFKGLNHPTELIWHIRPSRIYFTNVGQHSQLVTRLQDFFSEHNFYMVDNPQQARFNLQLELQNHSHSQRNGIHFAYVNASLKVYANSRKEAIFAKDCTNIKGVGISQNQAIINAVQEVYANLEQDLLGFVGN